MRASSCDRSLTVLSKVLLSLSGPARKVRAESRDGLAKNLERAIIFSKTGPELLRVVVPGDGRKALQL